MVTIAFPVPKINVLSSAILRMQRMLMPSQEPRIPVIQYIYSKNGSLPLVYRVVSVWLINVPWTYHFTSHNYE